MLSKHFICRRKNEFNTVYFLRFCTNHDKGFSKYRIELIVALSSTNATKMASGGVSLAGNNERIAEIVKQGQTVCMFRLIFIVTLSHTSLGFYVSAVQVF